MKSYLSMRTAFVVMVASTILAACTALGVPKAETFNQRLAVAYSSVTTARDTTAALVNSDVMMASDAQNVQNTLNQARAGLDVAANLYKIKPQDGEDKLVATLRILQAVDKYLNEVKK